MPTKKIAIIAALAPAIAMARPQPRAEPRAPTDTQAFEWSTGQDSRLGVSVIGLGPELRVHFGAPRDRGVLVAQVVPDSAAARAGIRVGDVITRFDAHEVSRAGELLASISKLEGPRMISIEVVRDRKPVTVQVALGRAREPSSAPI